MYSKLLLRKDLDVNQQERLQFFTLDTHLIEGTVLHLTVTIESLKKKMSMTRTLKLNVKLPLACMNYTYEELL